MYAGHIVEMAAVKDLFKNPAHPYTEALLKSIPRLDQSEQAITPIPGNVPPIDRMPVGCRFADRCNYRIPVCTRKNPALLSLSPKIDHKVRCWVRGASDQEVADV
jgi:oligopeptide/dipeptide ABC transporter ATP-binding protein